MFAAVGNSIFSLPLAHYVKMELKNDFFWEVPLDPLPRTTHFPMHLAQHLPPCITIANFLDRLPRQLSRLSTVATVGSFQWPRLLIWECCRGDVP